MAQLRDLIVNGASKFIGTVTFNNSVTFKDTLFLAKTQDLSGNSVVTNKPALVIGPVTGEHLEFDPNEIHAKTDEGTAGTLHLNANGGVVQIGNNLNVSNALIVLGVGTIGNGSEASSTKDGGLKISGGFKATSNSYITGTLTTTGNISTSSNLSVGGTATITGNLSCAGISTTGDIVSTGTNITLTGNNVDKFINLNHSGGTHCWRIGYLGSGSGNENYFVIETTGTDTAWDRAIQIAPETLDITVGRHILPDANGANNLGSSSLYWNNLYVNALNLKTKITTANGEASNSTSTGDIQVEGGIGVKKTSFFADKIYSGSTSYYIDGDATSVLNILTTNGQINAGSHIIPDANNANNLGSSSYRWKDIYSGTLNTSGGVTVGNKLTVTAGGATITAGGLTVTAGGMTVNAGTSTFKGPVKMIEGNAATSTTTGAL